MLPVNQNKIIWPVRLGLHDKYKYIVLFYQVVQANSNFKKEEKNFANNMYAISWVSLELRYLISVIIFRLMIISEPSLKFID